MLSAFMGEDGDQQDKELLKALGKANRDIKKAAAEDGVKIADIVSGVDAEHQVEHRAYTQANSAYISYATEGWDGRIIRRTGDSVQSDGLGVIQGVPPITISDAWVVLSPQELERIDAAGGPMDEE